MFSKKKSDNLQSVFERSRDEQIYHITGISFFDLVENVSSEKIPTINLGGYTSFGQYIRPLLQAIGQLVNPSQQQQQQTFQYNPTPTHHPPAMDPEKQKQIVSEALNIIKSTVGPLSTKSLRRHYLCDQENVVATLIRDLRLCFERRDVAIEQQIVIMYIMHKFAIATCAPQLVMEVLTYGTTLLTERNTQHPSSFLTELLPSNFSKSRLAKKRNIDSLITKMISATLKYWEKNSSFKLPEDWKGKLLLFDELPFLITNDLERLFQTMRRYSMSRNNSNFLKENVSKTALKYLNTVLERNVRNMDFWKLALANHHLVEFLTSLPAGIPNELQTVLQPIHFTIVSGQAASITYFKNLFSHGMEKEDDVKNSILSAFKYFHDIMSFYRSWIDTSNRNHDHNFIKTHILSRFNFITDFFILSTEQNQKYSHLYESIINDSTYFDCLGEICTALGQYVSRYNVFIDSDLWLQIEGSTRANHEKLSQLHYSCHWLTLMQRIDINIGLGLLNSAVELPDDWQNRSMGLHLGKMKKTHQEDNVSEVFEKMSISDFSDSKDSFCSISYDDPANAFSRIFPTEERTIEQIDEIYLEMFHYHYYREEKYHWISNLCIDPIRRQIILFTLCSVLKALLSHCGPNLSTDTLRRIHSEVHSVISFEKYTNDYNSVHPITLKDLLKDILLHSDQLVQINPLNVYYKTIEERHETEFFVSENEIFKAIFQKENYFTDMFRLGNLANSFSKHLDMFLDDQLILGTDYQIMIDIIFGRNHHDDSLIFNLESCGIEVFQGIIFKLLNIHVKHESSFKVSTSVQDKIQQILSNLKSEYYINIAIKCVLEIVVRLYFNKGIVLKNSFKKELIEGLADRSRMLQFYSQILKHQFTSSNMSASLASHSIASFKKFFSGLGDELPNDTSLILLLAPSLFTSRTCAEVLAKQSEIMQLIEPIGNIESNLHRFFFLLFKNSILRLAHDHTTRNQDIMVNFDRNNFFFKIAERRSKEPNLFSDFNRMNDEVSNFFYGGASNIDMLNYNDVQQALDNMYLYFSRYWLLQCQPKALTIKSFRESALAVENVNVLNNDYYPKDILAPSLDSIILELISDLSSDNTLLFKPTIWLIVAVETLSENANINSELFFKLFEASIKRLANNDTMVEILVILCRFLIKRSNIWEPYLAQNIATLNNSNFKVNLEKILKNIDDLVFKKTSITLHKYCVDLFQMVYITANKCSLQDAVQLLQQTPLNAKLYNELGETAFFKSFNMLIHALKANLSTTTFSQTYTNVLQVEPSVAFNGLNAKTTSLIPLCKYIQLLLRSPMAPYIIRNTNFSLFYSSNSNSKLLLQPFIKTSIPTEIKKKALLTELNIFTSSKQDICPSVVHLFLAKPNISKIPVPLDFHIFAQDPINVFKHHIGHMKFGSASDYSYVVPVQNMGAYGSEMNGIANIVVMNYVCQHLNHTLPQLTTLHEIATWYFVMGGLLGSSLICKYYLGPLNIDIDVLKYFVDGGSTLPSPKFDMANSFVTGLRSVLGDDMANFLKIFTVEELVSLSCDRGIILKMVHDFLHSRVDRDDGVSEIAAKNFLTLLESLVGDDIYFATLLLNYLDGLYTGMENREPYHLVLIPSYFKEIQINRSKKHIDIPVCQTREELKQLLLNSVSVIE